MLQIPESVKYLISKESEDGNNFGFRSVAFHRRTKAADMFHQYKSYNKDIWFINICKIYPLTGLGGL
jgi:hypothetical protein